MGLQLIFCVESNKQSQTDYIYIKHTIAEFYEFDRSSIKLSAVFMGGKGNYSLPNTQRQITALQKLYSAASSNNVSAVIYCFDCDNYDSNPSDSLFLQNAEAYCKKNGYYFAWFCKDIENVYLGKQISDKQKTGAAIAFASKYGIKAVKEDNLRVTKYAPGFSNLCLILDELLGEQRNTHTLR